MCGMLANKRSGLGSPCRRWQRARCCGGQEQQLKRRPNNLGISRLKTRTHAETVIETPYPRDAHKAARITGLGFSKMRLISLRSPLSSHFQAGVVEVICQRVNNVLSSTTPLQSKS